MAHIIFKGSLIVFETGAAAPKNNEKMWRQAPGCALGSRRLW